MGFWRAPAIMGAIILALAVIPAPPAAAECKFGMVGELPVTMRDMRPTITTKINGHEAVFVVDSGAFFSLVSKDTVTRFGMVPIAVPQGLRLMGMGGHSEDARAVKAQTFTFADVPFHNVEFLVADRAGGEGVVGLLGQNFLGGLDVEYDLANGVIRLFKAQGCGSANLAYWAKGMNLSTVRLQDSGPRRQQVRASAKIDGHSIYVVFDTGASTSILSRPAAARAGVRPTSEGVVAEGISHGLFGRGMETSLAPFGNFAIGGEEIQHTRLRMADIELSNGDMLLGADFFLSHRILVSNSQGNIYFTYNGGPVFQLNHPPSSAPAATAQPSVSTGASVATVGPTTAAQFSRRGSASMARRDFPAAIADFTRAIELEPNDGGRYHDRAMARLGNRQPVLAMADLDQALKFKPDGIPTLMTRGQLSLSAGDTRRAAGDFDAALKLAPNDDSLPISIGAAYAREGQYDVALQRYDAWIAAHPKSDVPRAETLNARCWTRAVWGQQLEMALADCDAALKVLKTSDVMDSRGLALLRLGRLNEAIAQYDAALRVQPKSAWSLYGRGLAKLKKGATAEGSADIAAALVIQPELPKQAARYGIALPEPAADKS